MERRNLAYNQNNECFLIFVIQHLRNSPRFSLSMVLYKRLVGKGLRMIFARSVKLKEGEPRGFV